MSGSWSRPNKKRKAYFYYSSQNKRRKCSLIPGLKGFLCKCNSKEKECIREAYNILNEYADRSPDQVISEAAQEVSEAAQEVSEIAQAVAEVPEVKTDIQDGGSEVDVDTTLPKELEQLKAEVKGPKLRRFQVLDSGATNCLFIQTSISDPVNLAVSIFEDIENTKQQKTRHLIRLLPVEITCMASMYDIKNEVAPLLDKYFKQEPKTFFIAFMHHNNHSVRREEVIRELAEMVTARNPLHKVNLKEAEMTVLVEVIRGMCCLSVLPDYFKYKKYNLLELCAPENVDGSGDAKQKDDEEVKAVENEKAAEKVVKNLEEENGSPDGKDIVKVSEEKQPENSGSVGAGDPTG